MYWLYYIFLILSCALLIYQDFKSRLLSVWVIAVFGAANILLCLRRTTVSQFMDNVLFCTSYLLFSYLVLLLYFYIKNRRFEKITDTKLGLGDIFILFLTGICLEPVTMIFFFTAALVVSLLLSLAFIQKNKSIPLAGLLLLSYLAYLCIDYSQAM